MPDTSRHCADCGAELHGEFCSRCGQHDFNINAPVKDLSKEFGEEVFSFDNRLLKSLFPFFFKPGYLTQEYIAGKRTRYVSPFKLYFFMSFLFFFSLTFQDNKNKSINLQGSSVDSVMHAAGVDSMARLKKSHISVREVNDSSIVKRIFGERLKRGVRKLKENPQLFFDSVLEHAPQVVFVLLPIFALILKMLYVRSKTYYFKHLVFSFHFHAFVFLVLLCITVLDVIGNEFISANSDLLILAIPLNLFMGMRRVYGQGRAKTLLKLLMLGSAYCIVFWAVVLVAVLLFISFL